MIELYIMRHGRTVWNASGKVQGSVDIDLNEEGRAAAIATGNVWEEMQLHFDAVYCSPLKRACDTAQLVSAYTGLPIWQDERLRELSFGILEGNSVEPNRNEAFDTAHGCFFAHPERYERPEGGESLEELCSRAQSFLGDLLYKYKHGERILIVAHGAMNKALLRVLKKSELKDFWEGKLQKNCGVTIVQTDGKKCIIIEEGKVFDGEGK